MENNFRIRIRWDDLEITKYRINKETDWWNTEDYMIRNFVKPRKDFLKIILFKSVRKENLQRPRVWAGSEDIYKDRVDLSR